MTLEMRIGQQGQTVQRPFNQESVKQLVAPRPVEKPQAIPPIRKPEVLKHHIKRTGKKPLP